MPKTCNFCGEPIEFRQLKTGKWIPVQAQDTDFIPDENGYLQIFYRNGTTVKGRRAEKTDLQRWSGREAHWQYCAYRPRKNQSYVTRPAPAKRRVDLEPEQCAEQRPAYEQINFLGG